MDKIQENTKIEKAILAEKQQIFLIQNKLSEIEKNIKEQCLTIEQIQNSITEKNQNLSNIEYKENQSIDSLENFFNTYSNWETYCQEIEKYLNLKKINSNEDSLKFLTTYSNLSDVKKRIEDEFTHRNAECDKYDYLIAITCGAIAGIMDIFLVGNPKDSYLGKKVDKTVEKMTQKFAQLCGWDKQKALDKNKDLTKSAIAFLENKFKINYDQTTTNGRNGTNGKVDNLSMKNHHLKSIGHSPDIFGLFVSIVNQFTNTSTFVSNGKIITIDTNTFELQGGNFIAKIFCGFFNWFGHLASDWCGSSGGKERGAGIPMPFYNLFLLCDFGNFGQHRQTLAQIATQVFEQGYDLRHGVTMSIPVMINEMLIRFMYIIKAKFYHKKEWKECIPKDDIPELNKMLLIGSGTFLLIDTGGAWIKSKNPITNPVVFLSEINLINVIRFSTLILKEIYILYNNGKIDNKKLEKYLDDTCKILLIEAHNKSKPFKEILK